MRELPKCVLTCALVFVLAGASVAADGTMPPYQRLIEEVAARHGLEADVFAALVDVESARRAGAVSEDGAQGLAQLMPATAERFKVVDPHNPEDNLDGAARYFSWLLERFEGELSLALAAYNAGEAAVDRHGGIPPYRETRGFVSKVLRKAGRPVPPDSEASAEPPPHAREPRPVRLLTTPDGRRILTNIPDSRR
jgi:soluble lytic murein transglycosylase-like protein